MASVSHVIVAAEYAGQRVDNFLLRELHGVPRTRVYRLLRRGEVRVNGSRVKPAHRLSDGDDIRLPPLRRGKGRVAEPSKRVLERLERAVIYEDERAIAVDKPSGMAVHGGSGLGYGVIEAMRVLRPAAPFLDLAHRLDRSTSGVLLLAKRRSVLRELHEMWRGGRIRKHYAVLLRGSLEDEVSVDYPLQRVTVDGESRMRVAPAGIGKSSLTRFRGERCGGGWTLGDAVIETGRMHQIRVHAAAIDRPVAGDERYGDADANTALRRQGLRRLFLHASRLAVPPGDTLPALDLYAPLPLELREVAATVLGADA